MSIMHSFAVVVSVNPLARDYSRAIRGVENGGAVDSATCLAARRDGVPRSMAWVCARSSSSIPNMAAPTLGHVLERARRYDRMTRNARTDMQAYTNVHFACSIANIQFIWILIEEFTARLSSRKNGYGAGQPRVDCARY